MVPLIKKVNLFYESKMVCELRVHENVTLWLCDFNRKLVEPSQPGLTQEGNGSPSLRFQS